MHSNYTPPPSPCTLNHNNGNNSCMYNLKSFCQLEQRVLTVNVNHCFHPTLILCTANNKLSGMVFATRYLKELDFITLKSQVVS